jgi:OOP family OmpA-OmpF porin
MTSHILARNGYSGRVAVAAAAAVAAATILSGCSTHAAISLPGCLTSSAAPLAVVVGVRSNVPTTQFPSAVTTLLQTAANDEQPISLIRIDGSPKIFAAPKFSTNDKNSAARGQDVIKYLNTVVNPIMSSDLRAQTPQADVLDALDLAASATGPNGNIVVVDSGLQTVAPLRYQTPGLLMSPPSDMVNFLRQKDLLPQLKGRHVLLSGFGYTQSPQPSLNQAQRDNLIDQWSAIVTAGGGCVTVDPAANTSPATAGLPLVSVVPLPPTPSLAGNCGTIVLSDAGSVGFIVDTANFRDPAAAQTTLQQLAATLKKGSEHIRLIGSTSSEGGDVINNPLSRQRADAVKSALVSLGIPASRITAVGDGSHWPGRVNDIGPGGVLLPAQAEQDREVIVQLPKCT